MNEKSLSKLKDENIESITALLPLAITSGGEIIGVLSGDPCDCVGQVGFTEVKRGKTKAIKKMVANGCHQLLKKVNRFQTIELEIYLRKP